MSSITTSIADGVCELTLARPQQRNAINVEMLTELNECLDQFARDADVRCLLITGEGRSFCAGADVEEWAQMQAEGRLETYGWTEKAHALMLKLQQLPKPTIAAINGAAVGAGLDLSMCCDFRYAASVAKFLPGYTRMAYSPDAGGSWLLPRLIGLDASREFLFFDEPWPANRAKQAGMVSEVYEVEELINAVRATAKTLAAGPTYAFGKTKQLLEQSLRTDFARQLELEKEFAIACGRTEDANEALAAVSEHRTPNFVGR
jgi:2-(1,2-epoxy-1,2-dihydrophenyl)acetyl-CoA isomerase